MTISYSHKVSKVRLCGFSRLLFYWRGSIYKLVYKEVLIFIASYVTLSMIYRFILPQIYRRTFEKIVVYCDAFTNLIPLSFILGFYVSIIVTRWWRQYENIPWPDRISSYVTCLIQGKDDRARMIRRTIIRYLNLAGVFIFQSISTPVKKRFPTLEHIIDAGLMTEAEWKFFEDTPSPHSKFWVPCMWACTLATKARNEGKIKDDFHLKAIIDEINTVRGNLGMLYSHDWISVPLVYTQVATLAVYMFFIASLFGRQFLDPTKGYRGHEVDLYIPVFTLVQFFFYMGWLKVAEQLINPFGEDDDDFDINWIIDRNLQVGLLSVDDMHMECPQLERDRWWGDSDADLPYTKSSLGFKTEPFMGSTADCSYPKEDTKFVNLQTINETALQGLSIIKSSPTLPQSNFQPVNLTLTSPVKRKMFIHGLSSNSVSTETLDRNKLSPKRDHADQPLLNLHVASEKPANSAYVTAWVSTQPTVASRAIDSINQQINQTNEVYPFNVGNSPSYDNGHKWVEANEPDLKENAEIMKQWFEEHEPHYSSGSEKSLVNSELENNTAMNVVYSNDKQTTEAMNVVYSNNNPMSSLFNTEMNADGNYAGLPDSVVNQDTAKLARQLEIHLGCYKREGIPATEYAQVATINEGQEVPGSVSAPSDITYSGDYTDENDSTKELLA